MSVRYVARFVRIVLLVTVLAAVAGQALGQPLLLGYVSSDSMEPAMDAGDGFVAVPAALAGDVEPGDVIVYEAGGVDDELVTHRVVRATDDGYVTRGDANPVTDQQDGEPHVPEDRIVATALQIDGTVVTIPGLGVAVTTTGTAFGVVQAGIADVTGTGGGQSGRAVASLLLVLSLAGYAIETVRERRRWRLDRRIDDGTTEPRRVAVAVALVVAVAATAAMVVPAGAESIAFVSTDPAPDGELLAEPGGIVETSYRVSNAGFAPIVAYLETNDRDVVLERRSVSVSGRDSRDVPVSITTPESEGHYERTVVEHRYLYLLPRPVIDALYDRHPWLPLGTIVALLGAIAYVLCRRLIDSSGSRPARKGGYSTRNQRFRIER